MNHITPEELLAHKDWIRSLVRSLLADEDLVDDVLQETWLAFYESAKEIVSPKAWLARVARNKAFRQLRHYHRADLNSGLAEETVDAFSDPARIIESEAVRDRVMVSVFQVKDPFRRVLLLRHYDELDLDEIASKLDIAPSTARTRLHRGRQELRRMLEREEIDGAPVWSLLPLMLTEGEKTPPLANPPRPHNPGHPEGVTTAGSSTALVAGASLLTALVAVGVWALVKPASSVHAATIETTKAQASERSPSAPAPRKQREAVVGALEGPSPSRTSLRQGSVENAEAFGISVIAYRDRARWDPTPPQPDTTVIFECRTGLESGGELLERATLQTDDSGLCHWYPATPEQACIFYVSLSEGQGEVREIPYLPGDPSPDLVELNAFPHDVRTWGFLRAATTGAPIANASVSNLGAATSSDAEGYFSTFTSSLWSPNIVFSAEGFADKTLAVPNVELGTQERFLGIIVLEPETVTSFQVVDPQGRSLEGAEAFSINRFDLSLKRVAVSDNEGLVVVARLNPMTPLLIRKEGYASTGFLAAQVDSVVPLAPECLLEGLVFTPNGLPARKAAVTCGDPDELSNPRAFTDAEGAFTLRGLAEGTYEICVDSDEGTWIGQVELPLQQPLVIELEPGTAISGRVLNEFDEPVYPGRVEASSSLHRLEIAETAPDGSYTLASVPHGHVQLEVSGKGMVTRSFELESSMSRDNLVHRLPRSSWATGRVLGRGTPIQRFAVYVHGYSHQPQWFETSDGTWDSRAHDFEMAPLESITVEIMAEGYAPICKDLLVSYAPTQDDIHLQPGAAVAGTVRYEDTHHPVVGSRISLDSASSDKPCASAGFGQGPTYSGPNGQFELKDLPPGDWRLRIELPNGEVHYEGPFFVQPGGSLHMGALLIPRTE